MEKSSRRKGLLRTTSGSRNEEAGIAYHLRITVNDLLGIFLLRDEEKGELSPIADPRKGGGRRAARSVNRGAEKGPTPVYLFAHGGKKKEKRVPSAERSGERKFSMSGITNSKAWPSLQG